MRSIHIHTSKSGGRGRLRPIRSWQMVTFVVAAALLAWLVVRGVSRQSGLAEWRRSLEVQGADAEWPSWDSAWPALPAHPIAPNRTTPMDVHGPAAFAARNAETMRHIPCYCGACPADHLSNLNCYVIGFRSDGAPMWTDHASTCAICVRVTREVMLMVRQGYSLPAIQQTLDHEYVRAGYHSSASTHELRNGSN